MKSLLFAVISLFLSLIPAGASNISSAGVNGTDGGLLKVDQTDPYWWFCVQPDRSRGPIDAGPIGYTADIVSLDYGWTRQTTDRFAFAGATEATNPEAFEDLARQVNVIEYILDTYLPWDETTDNFLNKVADPASSTDQDANDDFFNRFYAAQQYIKKLYNKLYDDNTSFTDLSVYAPTSDIPNVNPTDIARNDYFNAISKQIRDQAAAAAAVDEDFFFDYTAMHDYAMVNTFFDQNSAPRVPNPNDWQDAIIIGRAVPEPSTGLLAFGSVLLLSRRRRA
jgi:PEP-CTERM motif